MRALGLATAMTMLASCEPGDDAAEPAATAEATARHPEAPPGIAWFGGDVPEAFARAAELERPVFLYWGAVWCPYCADLKAHVFSRRDVQERLELFVPVYLDGDDPGAQKWAETFGIAGYPTVLALAPDRTELARIAGGMDLSVYGPMLDLVLGDLRPVGEMLDAVEATDEPLSSEDCRRLAYNGWVLDDSLDSDTAQIAAVLAKAVEQCPATGADRERARLAVVAASYAAANAADTAATESTRDLLRSLIDEVQRIVAEPELAASVTDALLYLDADFFSAARELDPDDAARLLEHWSIAMDEAADETRYTEADRLFATRSKLEATKTLGAVAGDVPATLATEAMTRVDTALAQATGTPAFPAVVNAAINVLVSLDEMERAYTIAEQAMQTSKTPYYYMSDLAWLDEHMGNIEAAIDWRARAYREATGPATRFQWGANYVQGLIRMTPDDEAAIREATLDVLGELDGPDRIYRRTRARLESLDAALRTWNQDGMHAAALAAARSRMDDICAGITAEDSEALTTCRNFLRHETSP